MASILTPTTFKVNIQEEHIVKNTRTVNDTTFEINNVTNVDRRIVTCPTTTSISLIDINGVNPGAGTFPSSSLQYVRITNLDNAYNLMLTFSSSKDEYWSQELTPTSSYFLASADVTGSGFVSDLSSSIENIKAYAISSSIDVEYVLVNA